MGNELRASLTAPLGIKLDLRVPQSPPAPLLVASSQFQPPLKASRDEPVNM